MNLNSMIQLLNNNSLDHYLFEITQNDPSIEKKRILHLIQQTMKYYGEGDYHLFSSPARSELIGNHCDHQNGKVIATTINVDMLALVKINPSCSIHLTSLELETIDMDCFDLSFQEHEIHTSQSLIRGIASAMALDNHLPYGFVGCIQSNIPIGSGLSSSAAFEVLIAIIMNHFFYNNQYTPIELAQFCQQSENHYYQKPCGLMDQLSISYGGCISIDFHDPTLPQILPLDFDFKRYGFQLILFDTLNHHAHLSHEYALIPQEMKSVAKILGNEVLGACKKEDFLLNLPSLNLNNDRSLLRSLHFLMKMNVLVK